MAVIVSVADDRLGALADVVAALRRAGLRVDEVLEPLGMVTGTVAADGMAALGAVPGVAEVERQRGVRLDPP